VYVMFENARICVVWLLFFHIHLREIYRCILLEVVADRRRSGTHESKQEDFRSLFWGNGGAAVLPQSFREKAFGKVLELGSGEPKTMVVKKTPKRVHNSDPSAMFSRSELLMFEDSMRSPGSVPRVMLTSSNKQGRPCVLGHWGY
jgi:hypothetical protein